MAAEDHVAPLSAIIDALSIGIGGPSEFWLRVPAAVASTLAAAMAYAVTRRILHDQTIAFGAGIFTAVAPFAVWYGQEARMYSLLLLLALMYVWACWPLTQGRATKREWVLMTIGAALGLWTHHYMGLLIIAFGLFLITQTGLRSRRLWMWAGTQAIAALTFVPWLLLTQGQGNGTGFEKSGQLLWLPYTFFSYLAGLSLGPSVRDLRLTDAGHALLQQAPAVGLTVVAMAVIAIAGLPVLWKRSKAVTAWILCWGAVPPALAVAATYVADVSYNARYAITALPALSVLVGAALSRLATSWLARTAAVLAAGVVAWSLTNWYTDPRYAKDDLRSAAVALAQQMRPGDVLILDNSHASASLEYYGWRCSPSDIVISSPSGAQAVAASLSPRTGSGTTWLLVFRPWESDPNGAVAAALHTAGRGQTVGSWPGSSLTRYTGTGRTPSGDGVSVGCAA
ncbi:glycosyltransferase family 39 protein [Sinomonas sp. RB5]